MRNIVRIATDTRRSRAVLYNRMVFVGGQTADDRKIRGAFQAAIGQLKALGCEDTMILVEFWHALDCVNGEDFSDV